MNKRTVLMTIWRTVMLAVALIIAGSTARAQTPSPPYVASVIELEIVPALLEPFLDALRSNAAAAIKEPGCRRYDIMQSASNSNLVVIYEVYDNEDAVRAHRQGAAFKTYVTDTKGMVAKRQSRAMAGVVTYSK